MIKVTEIKQTCYACPSQWEGKTSDNRSIYVRYRWGTLSITISEPYEEAIRAIGGKTVFYKQLGDGLDGVLSYLELIRLTKGIVEWPAIQETIC